MTAPTFSEYYRSGYHKLVVSSNATPSGDLYMNCPATNCAFSAGKGCIALGWDVKTFLKVCVHKTNHHRVPGTIIQKVDQYSFEYIQALLDELKKEYLDDPTKALRLPQQLFFVRKEERLSGTDAIHQAAALFEERWNKCTDEEKEKFVEDEDRYTIVKLMKKKEVEEQDEEDNLDANPDSESDVSTDFDDDEDENNGSGDNEDDEQQQSVGEDGDNENDNVPFSELMGHLTKTTDMANTSDSDTDTDSDNDDSSAAAASSPVPAAASPQAKNKKGKKGKKAANHTPQAQIVAARSGKSKSTAAAKVKTIAKEKDLSVTVTRTVHENDLSKVAFSRLVESTLARQRLKITKKSETLRSVRRNLPTIVVTMGTRAAWGMF